MNLVEPKLRKQPTKIVHAYGQKEITSFTSVLYTQDDNDIKVRVGTQLRSYELCLMRAKIKFKAILNLIN